ncbi:MAG: manganese/zinc/iron transport system permease protein, partial [Candidatus Marinamargulisbacteria bacterium]
MDLIHDIFFDYTLRTVMLGTLVLGIVSGALGSFAVLRKQSLLGDAISHAALPGIAVAFLLTESKSPAVLLFGAIASGWIGTILMTLISEKTKLKKDSALGIVLSVFFGLGLVLLTLIQRMPTASKSGLNKFLFGNAATLLQQDVVTMAIFGVFVIICTALLWKEFKLISFDAEFAVAIGLPYKRLDILLTTLIVIAIVIGLQTVGVVLMSAMVVAPAAAARQWTDRLGFMVVLSAFFGATSGIIGVLISTSIDHMPTGPTVVLVVSAFVFISLFFAPNRGLMWGWIRHQRNRQKIQGDTLLTNLYFLSRNHEDKTYAHNLDAL